MTSVLLNRAIAVLYGYNVSNFLQLLLFRNMLFSSKCCQITALLRSGILTIHYFPLSATNNIE